MTKSVKILLPVAFAVIISCNDSGRKKPELDANQKTLLTESIKRGALVYEDFCMSCHLPDGKGVPKAFPPLANSDYLENNPIKSIKAVKYGMSGEIKVNGETYNGVMTPLGLTNKEIADVMNYISNSWGNNTKSLITEKEVSKIQQ